MQPARPMPCAYLDEPWLRLSWVVPVALMLWAALLTAFAMLLERTAAPPPLLAPAELRIIQLPPTSGLQGGPAPASAPAKPKPELVRPHPHIRIHRAPVRIRPHHIPKAVPELSPSANGTARHAAKAPAVAGKRAPAAPSHAGVSGGTGSGAGAGLGSDSGGARAVFAPKPVIPDALRRQVFRAVAVAHFLVSRNGQVQVTLTTPTQSPRLNELLLETLKQWRFFPAVKNGVAVDSQFDVRIPISVQ